MGYRHKNHVVQGVICVTTHYLLSDEKKKQKILVKLTSCMTCSYRPLSSM